VKTSQLARGPLDLLSNPAPLPGQGALRMGTRAAAYQITLDTAWGRS